MKIKVLYVNIDTDEFNIPKGYEPFSVFRQYGSWVVFCRPTGA